MKKLLAGALTLLILGQMAALAASTDPDASLRSRVVRLTGGQNGMCSGEQVRAPSGRDYLLSAAHCRMLADHGSMRVEMEDGTILQRKVIAEDEKSDLLLLEGLPHLPGVPVADIAPRFTRVRTFTHGNDLDTYETEGVLIQSKEVKILIGMVDGALDELKCRLHPDKFKIEEGLFGKACVLKVVETYSTAFTAPGSSGGLVVNSAGELVGVVSAGGGGYSLFVTLADIQRFLATR